jgi:hypothetical protein
MVKLDLSDISLVRRLLYVIRDAYQDPEATPGLRTRVRFWLSQVLDRKRLDIGEFLKSKDRD